MQKADNLKEALNLYDDTMHKARMEEMQAAIQNASEIAAVEAAKQTALTKDIAKNTHQAATAAKATAYHTRQIDKNTGKDYSVWRGLMGEMIFGASGFVLGMSDSYKTDVEAYWVCKKCDHKFKA